jgi:hypothetical protein
MYTTIKASNGTLYGIESEFFGDRAWDCNSRNCNNHEITVENTDTGKYETFDFWASIANPGIDTEDELFSAFVCIVQDALLGSQTLENMIDEFGYYKGICDAYAACEGTADKFLNLGLHMDEIEDLLEKLEDYR